MSHPLINKRPETGIIFIRDIPELSKRHTAKIINEKVVLLPQNYKNDTSLCEFTDPCGTGVVSKLFFGALLSLNDIDMAIL